MVGINWEIFQKEFLEPTRHMDFKVVRRIISDLTVELKAEFNLGNLEVYLVHELLDWTYAMWMKKEDLRSFPSRDKTKTAFANYDRFFASGAKVERKNFCDQNKNILSKDNLKYFLDNSSQSYSKWNQLMNLSSRLQEAEYMPIRSFRTKEGYGFIQSTLEKLATKLAQERLFRENDMNKSIVKNSISRARRYENTPEKILLPFPSLTKVQKNQFFKILRKIRGLMGDRLQKVKRPRGNPGFRK